LKQNATRDALDFQSCPFFTLVMWFRRDHPEIFLRCKNLARSRSKRRRDNRFDENPGDFGSGVDIDLPIQSNDRSKRRYTIRLKRFRVSLAQRTTDCSPAWIRVLNNAAGRIVKFLNQIPGRFEVHDVVVRQFLTLKLACRGKSMRRLAAPLVERCLL